MSEGLYLGIDGGGSKCRARIRDSAGRLLGEAAGGHANIYRDRDEARQSIIATAQQAALAAGPAEHELARLQAGVCLARLTPQPQARGIEAEDWPPAHV